MILVDELVHIPIFDHKSLAEVYQVNMVWLKQIGEYIIPHVYPIYCSINYFELIKLSEFAEEQVVIADNHGWSLFPRIYVDKWQRTGAIRCDKLILTRLRINSMSNAPSFSHRGAFRHVLVPNLFKLWILIFIKGPLDDIVFLI